MPLEHLNVWCPHCGKELREMQMTRAYADALFSNHLSASASCAREQEKLRVEGVVASHFKMVPGNRPIAES